MQWQRHSSDHYDHPHPSRVPLRKMFLLGETNIQRPVNCNAKRGGAHREHTMFLKQKKLLEMEKRTFSCSIYQEDLCTDEEILVLLLKNHLVARVVDTAFYAPLVSYVLNEQRPGEEPPYFLSVENIANQLQQAGHEAEAGALLLQHRGVHPAAQTFDTAIAYVTRWFSR